MARFETPGQIAGLFACAALVSVLVVMAFRAEATRRFGQETEKNLEHNIQGGQFDRDDIVADEDHADDGNVIRTLSDVKRVIREFAGLDAAASNVRRKRSITEEDGEVNDDSHESLEIQGPDLAEGLLSASLGDRLIRNLPSKVARLNPDYQVVQEILKQFCDCQSQIDDATQNITEHYQREIDTIQKSSAEALAAAYTSHAAELAKVMAEEEESKRQDHNVEADDNKRTSIVHGVEEDEVREDHHSFPPIKTHIEGFVLPGEVSPSSQVTYAETVCPSCGETLFVVCLTTLINFSLCCCICFCKKLLGSHKDKEGFAPFINDDSASSGSIVIEADSRVPL